MNKKINNSSEDIFHYIKKVLLLKVGVLRVFTFPAYAFLLFNNKAFFRHTHIITNSLNLHVD